VNILRIRSRSITAVLVALLVPAIAVPPALASTLSDKKAQAAAVQVQLSNLEKKAEIATEAYNQSRDAYDKLTAKVRTAQTRVNALTAKRDTLQTALGNRADAMYRTDDTLGVVQALLSAHSIEDLASTIELLTRISEQDAATVAQVKLTREEAQAAKQELQTAQAAALVERNAMAANEAAARKQVAARAHVLASLKADIKKIIARQQAAEAAAARARWRALRGSRGNFYDPGGNPPSSSKGALAVWWAEKALGRPYVWGASGPYSFDCSGLTMWAYRHAGVRLPHYSGGQINCGSRVGRSNLQPGDLVFFGSPIHHVGMYVGHGDFIEAPHAGASVRISSLSDRMGDYAGACRP
jgi:peptidoglycan DL-endopeptidase CwlO